MQLFDFGEDQNGTPYLAFELLTGEPLTKRLGREGGQPEKRIAHLALKVLEVLNEAHSHGVVHRDIKPSNVFLCDYAGQRDFIKLLDFGIAKRAGADATQLTAVDEFVGTPRYMAPELLAAHPATAACDLYSLGLMMAEMLSGTSIYRGSPIEVCMQVLSPDPIPFPPVVESSRLRDVIHRATMKDPAQRYVSAGAMMADLHATLGGVASSSRAPDGSAPRRISIPYESAPVGLRTTNPPTSAVPFSAPVSASVKSLPRVPSSRRPLKLVLALVAATLAGALVVAGAFGALKLQRSRQPAVIEPSVTPMPPARFERRNLRARLSTLGYEIVRENSELLVAKKGDLSATLSVRDLGSEADGSVLVASRAVDREGQWALEVSVQRGGQPSADLSAQLLKELTAR